MDLIARSPAPGDIAGCYRVCYGSFGYPEEPGNNVARELKALWGNPPTLVCLVEDRERPSGWGVVGYWDAVFVTDAFVRWARTDMPPFVNIWIAGAVPGGPRVLLEEQGIAAAQSGEGLNLLVTHWGWDAGLPDADRLRVQERLSHEFFRALRGYNVKEVLTEVVSRDLCRLALSLGYRLRRGHGEDPEREVVGGPDLRPFLVGAARGETGLGEWISPAFVHTSARFYFTPAQQSLLEWALRGGSDVGFGEAQRPPISAGAVKKRWDEIFARVERARWNLGLPPLLPEAAGGRRGAEKRGPLLEYLREHPEELRPTARPRRHAERDSAGRALDGCP